MTSAKKLQESSELYIITTSVILKRRVRTSWEAENLGLKRYVWGYDCTEKNRIERIKENELEMEHIFPLMEHKITKEDAHGILNRLGIKRPAMYDLGYHNNNCIACLKGGMGYWNKIRIDFPEVFKERAELERFVGRSCINGVFLDELEPNRGRHADEIMGECGIACELVYKEYKKEDSP